MQIYVQFKIVQKTPPPKKHFMVRNMLKKIQKYIFSECKNIILNLFTKESRARQSIVQRVKEKV